MKARARAAGHAMHPMLIVFPLGLLTTAAIFDLVHLLFETGEAWPTASFYMIGAGLVGGVVAAATGTLDWLKIPKGTRAKRLGLYHGIGNDLFLALMLGAWLLRLGIDEPGHPANLPILVLELVAVLLSVVTGWMGGELVERLGVGVDPGADVDAPSSLKVKHLQPANRDAGRLHQ